MKIIAEQRPTKKSFTVRLSDEQREFIERIARQEKAKPADVIRTLVLNAIAKAN